MRQELDPQHGGVAARETRRTVSSPWDFGGGMVADKREGWAFRQDGAPLNRE